ncbi:hypothetical protein, partial [Haloarchaeobius sp. TZWSO28]|uniref:hypothetical protein n=1 Tax=Haloarchaeobius sp. TZWSO28 TaxID=3446119 RepID=UPI003EBECDD2
VDEWLSVSLPRLAAEPREPTTVTTNPVTFATQFPTHERYSTIFVIEYLGMGWTAMEETPTNRSVFTHIAGIPAMEGVNGRQRHRDRFATGERVVLGDS